VLGEEYECRESDRFNSVATSIEMKQLRVLHFNKLRLRPTIVCMSWYEPPIITKGAAIQLRKQAINIRETVSLAQHECISD
jgi:hypothetical protein